MKSKEGGEILDDGEEIKGGEESDDGTNRRSQRARKNKDYDESGFDPNDAYGDEDNDDEEGIGKRGRRRSTR